MVHPVHTVRVILPLFLSAEGRHRPSLDILSDGIPSMGALRAGRPEIQAVVPVDCLCCAQATGELHHQKVDAGTSGCIDPFGSTPTRSPIHLAPRRLLLDDLHTTCWVLHAAQSLTSKSWVPISIFDDAAHLALFPAVPASHIGLRTGVRSIPRDSAIPVPLGE